MKRDTISKTIRMPRRLNESIGEFTTENNISLNKFIVCSCAFVLAFSRIGVLDKEEFAKMSDEYGKNE